MFDPVWSKVQKVFMRLHTAYSSAVAFVDIELRVLELPHARFAEAVGADLAVMDRSRAGIFNRGVGIQFVVSPYSPSPNLFYSLGPLHYGSGFTVCFVGLGVGGLRGCVAASCRSIVAFGGRSGR